METQKVHDAPEEMGEIADLIIGAHHDLLDAIDRLQRVQQRRGGQTHLIERALAANEAVIVLEAELLVSEGLESWDRRGA